MIRDTKRSPWRPGSWSPGRLGLVDSMCLTCVLIVLALVRSYDYLTPSGRPTPSLAVVEAAMPMTVWGIVFGTLAVVLVVSVLARVHAGVWIGHWALGIAYAALAVGLGSEYVTHPWFDGIRTAIGMVLPAYVHIVIGMRTGWRSMR